MRYREGVEKKKAKIQTGGNILLKPTHNVTATKDITKKTLNLAELTAFKIGWDRFA